MVKLKEDTEINKSFKNISDSSWDKIIIRSINFSPTEIQADSPNLNNFKKIMVGDNSKLFVPGNSKWGNTYSTFINDEAFNDVIKIFSKAKQFIKSRDTAISASGKEYGINPTTIFNDLMKSQSQGRYEKGNDLFIGVVYRSVTVGEKSYSPFWKIRSKEIFDFLKKYSNDNTIPVIYSAGVDYDEKEFEGTNAPIDKPTPPVPTPPTPIPPKPEETPEEKIKRLEKENEVLKTKNKDLEDELKRLKDEWDKDFSDSFTGGLTVDNLKNLKEKYDKSKKAESNFAKCQEYTGQLAEALANANVDDSQIPNLPLYETRSLIEVPAKK